MRLLGCLVVGVCITALSVSGAVAQQAADQRHPDETADTSHKHRDHHHGHDHIYPDRGSILHELPRGAIPVNYAGFTYSVSDGVWLETRGHAFIVVSPAVGAVVMTLPPFATPIENGSETYLYANDIYYRARPDLGGYEVVNDPDEVIAPVAAASIAAPAAAAPTVAPAVAPAAAPTAAPAAAPPPANSAVPATVAAAALTTAAVTSTPTPLATSGTAVASTAAPSTASHSAKMVPTPKSGQSPDVQARDRYECYRFAVTQSGFADALPAGGLRPRRGALVAGARDRRSRLSQPLAPGRLDPEDPEPYFLDCDDDMNLNGAAVFLAAGFGVR